jgi:hypothetical protein
MCCFCFLFFFSFGFEGEEETMGIQSALEKSNNYNIEEAKEKAKKHI